ncbi:uncharacterized protein LOC119111350 [Pollicipes pollicipes]|uniref:uncharacterized protein LOC119111350 n=1 Tax=Pollicipes pollicipes TaxID=41117 RepID=UPI00188579C5|nr:uncharacterized protein LOC119111350 [Pollicipes pollicipes]
MTQPAGVVQKIGSPCAAPADCQQVRNGLCNSTSGTCQCAATHPIPNEISCLTEVKHGEFSRDGYVPAAWVNESCTISSQCRPEESHSQCVRGVCTCDVKYYIHTYTDDTTSCLLRAAHVGDEYKTPVDPVMIGILASLVLMFVIICVVLRLFSKAQFRQNRTILNSANPRLMNASFLKGSLIKSPVEQLRESRGSHSSRGSRAPSLTSLQRAEGEAAAENGEQRRTSAADGADLNHVKVEVTGHGR